MCLIVFLALAGISFPAMAENIVTHKALYEFKMVAVQPGADITAIKGKMYFEQDDACDAWTTDHRFTTEYYYAERRPQINASHYVAYESKDQKQFSFSSERQENGEMTEQLRGSVEIAADGKAKAVYSRPNDLSYDLPQGYFLPMKHTMEVLRRARSGESFFNGALFDGTDAEGPIEVSTFIGKKATSDEVKKISGDNKKIDPALLTPEAWHIRMSVFPLMEREVMTPAYEMDMIMHDNGVISHALIDYKTFKLEQSLSALEKLPQRKCG